VEALRDWRGEATILAPRLKYELNPKFNGAPTVNLVRPASHSLVALRQSWQRGVRPHREARARDFFPILDGGFSLQYSPLMEYREGKGMVLFCQWT
jgi:hypothetical protein